MHHDLREAIRDLVDDLASKVIDVLRAATPSELHDARTNSRNTKPDARMPRSRHRRRKHSPNTDVVGADTLLDQMLDALRASPQGLRSEDLRARLRAEKATFRLVAREAIAADLIAKTGARRATMLALK
ncbi:hypothetical protein LVJ94_17180 [Pendulispora rubella]|uniref:Uncharacterized protein n=1 Tax=Pendulispora rubella TaxID=2741070 RepID=A0ABZ2LII1_9BACT